MRSLLLIASALAMAACSANAQRGEDQASGDDASRGEQGRRDFQVGAFEAVSLEGSHDVVVTVGGAASVRAEGDSRMIERLDIRVENGTLKIGTQRGNWLSGMRGGHVTVHVTAPSISAASIGGSGDMRIDRVQGPRFAASIGGSGDMEIAALQARQANFSVAGSGGIRASGRAESADISIAGSGNVALDALEARTADVSVVGSGDVSIRASETVSASIMGSGDVIVHGSARCTVSKMGSGDVRCGG